MKAVRTAFVYLNKSKDCCISAQIYMYDDDVDIEATLDKCSLEPEDWSFMADSDRAGNAEVQNRCRSQNVLIINLNGAPVMCESKASSFTFASTRICEAHADISSARAEMYSLGNATMTIMGLSYVV